MASGTSRQGDLELSAHKKGRGVGCPPLPCEVTHSTQEGGWSETSGWVTCVAREQREEKCYGLEMKATHLNTSI